MNKDKLRESFLKKWNSSGNVRRNPEPIWSWITSNFIFKEEVEGLKMEKMIVDTTFWEEHERALPKGYNKCVDELNSKINKLIK